MSKSGQRLRSARKLAGFRSARAAAIKHGWPPSTYSSHENGQTPVPNDAAFEYAKAFKASALWILYDIGPRQGGIDAMLAGQPEEVWDIVRATAEAAVKSRR